MEKHLTFKGIPINGTYDQIISQFEAAGFTRTEESGRSVMFRGAFADMNCKAMIKFTHNSNIPCLVLVISPVHGDFNSLEQLYNKFKLLYCGKYGTAQSVEQFNEPYYRGDGYEETAIRQNKCSYVSRWALPEGEIKIGISSNLELLFLYEDKINSLIAEQEENSVLLDEI